MGTLLNQEPREQSNVDLNDVIDWLKSSAAENDISFAQAIAVWRVGEMRRANDLVVEGGDIHDEQMAGLGQILSRIATSLEVIAEAVAAARGGEEG